MPLERLIELPMRRLLLTLLIACLALPAVAVEACAPPPQDAAMAMHGHHAPPAPVDEDQTPDTAAQHGCIGCVPPLAVSALPAGAPLITRPFADRPPTLNIAPPYGPTPPPPRLHA